MFGYISTGRKVISRDGYSTESIQFLLREREITWQIFKRSEAAWSAQSYTWLIHPKKPSQVLPPLWLWPWPGRSLSETKKPAVKLCQSFCFSELSSAIGRIQIMTMEASLKQIRLFYIVFDYKTKRNTATLLVAWADTYKHHVHHYK